VIPPRGDIGVEEAVEIVVHTVNVDENMDDTGIAHLDTTEADKHDTDELESLRRMIACDLRAPESREGWGG